MYGAETDGAQEANVDREGGSLQERTSSFEGRRQYLSSLPTLHDRRIYILGVGGLGKLMAFSLADIPNRPPISLLFHRAETMDLWRRSRQAIELIKHGVSDVRTGFDAESSNYLIEPETDYRNPIYNLIVCTKANFTAKAIFGIKHRLRPESTVVLLQNGMGLIEDLYEELFPDPEERPHFMQGVVTHGVFNMSRFKAEHTGKGTIALAIATKEPFEKEHVLTSPVTLLAPSSRYLLRTLTRTPTLAAFATPPSELVQLQLEKLAVNAVVNPLTAVFGCRNGNLLDKTAVSRLMRLLLAEISLVIRSLPELQGLPNIYSRFSPSRLETRTVDILELTARNYSSMLQDVRKGIATEIDKINGYIVRRGEELGIRCVANYTVMQMVHARSTLEFRGFDLATPIPNPLPDAREVD